MGSCTDQLSLLPTALPLSPLQPPLCLPTIARFLCPQGLAPQAHTDVVFFPGHLQEHVGGKLDWQAGSRKHDLLEWLAGESMLSGSCRGYCRGLQGAVF